MTKQTDITNIEPFAFHTTMPNAGIIYKINEIIAAIRYLGDNCAMEHRGEGVPDGWTAWHGGNQPIDNLRVEYKLRNGKTHKDKANDLYWFHDGDSADIIAYRVIESSSLSIKPKSISESDLLSEIVELQQQWSQAERGIHACAVAEKRELLEQLHAKYFGKKEGE